jgi:methylenetetrahydrofolate reductase (NADPH)
VHASSLDVSAAVARLGVEPIMNVSCRDRNCIALQADILGASLHDIENVLCVSGDAVTAGDQSESRRVFDLDSPQLLSVRLPARQ